MRAALRAVADGARRVGGQDPPRRLDRRAEHAVGVGHADARRARSSPARTTSSGRATSTTPPPRRRRPATTRRRRGSLDYLWRVQKPDGSWWQNTTRRRRRRSGRASSSTRPRCRSCSPGGSAGTARTTGSNIRARGRLHRRRTARDTGQERWENQDGWSPNTIATEIAALVCAADVARAQRRPGARRVATRPRPTTGRRRSRAGRRRPTARTRRSRTTCASPRTATPTTARPTTLGDNFPRPVDQREIVDNSFLGLVLFGVKRWNDPTILNSLAVGDARARSRCRDTPSGPDLAPLHVRRLRRDRRDGGDWDIFSTTPRRQTLGRAWPLLAGERGEYELIAGSDARRAPARRSRAPPTTG